MEWFFFFKDGMPQMVRLAFSRGMAIEQVECAWGTRWKEFEKKGYTCIRETDVPIEEWDRIGAAYVGKKKQLEKEHNKQQQAQHWEQMRKGLENKKLIKDEQFFYPQGVSPNIPLETSRYYTHEN